MKTAIIISAFLTIAVAHASTTNADIAEITRALGGEDNVLIKGIAIWIALKCAPLVRKYMEIRERQAKALEIIANAFSNNGGGQ